MRILDFDWFPGGKFGKVALETYEILYDGLLNSGRGFEAPAETRVVSRIQDKFEAIGKATERGGVTTFTLNQLADLGSVGLEDAEYRLMSEALKAVKWNARAARAVTIAMDFFAEAPSVEAPQVDAPVKVR